MALVVLIFAVGMLLLLWIIKLLHTSLYTKKVDKFDKAEVEFQSQRAAINHLVKKRKFINKIKKVFRRHHE